MDAETKILEHVLTRIAALAERVECDVAGTLPSELATFDAMTGRLKQAGKDIALLAGACSLIRRLRD